MKKTNSEELEMLLGAYRDGELTTTQQNRVEKYLSENPQGQALLSDINATASTLSNIPVVKAPAGMAESIMLELERNELVGNDNALAALAGQKQLRIRNFAMVATLMLIVGVISYILMNGYFGQTMSFITTAENDKIVVDTTNTTKIAPIEEAVMVTKQLEVLYAKPNRLGLESVAASLLKPSVVSTSPSKIHLLLSVDNQGDALNHVASNIDNANIKDPFTNSHLNSIEYMFTATPEQLEKFVHLNKSQLHMIIANYAKNSFTRIDNVTFTQIETVASYLNTDDQLAATNSWDHYQVSREGKLLDTTPEVGTETIVSNVFDEFFTDPGSEKFKGFIILGPKEETSPLKANSTTKKPSTNFNPSLQTLIMPSDITPATLPVKAKLFGIVLTVTFPVELDAEEKPDEINLDDTGTTETQEITPTVSPILDTNPE